MLLPYEPWHLDMIRLPAVIPGFSQESPAVLAWLGKRGLAFSIVEDRTDGPEVIGIVGAAPLMPESSIAEVFVIGAAHKGTRHVAFVKGVRQALDHARKHFAIIEAVADADVPDRWFEWLGFVKSEGGGARWRLAGGGAKA